MKVTVAKLGVLGLGVFLVSNILKNTVAKQAQFAPRGNTVGIEGYNSLMNGYDPLAEAIGCACDGSFDDQSVSGEGLGSFGSKLKKAIKKPLSLAKRDLKKIAAPVQKVVKKELKQVKRLAISNPLGALKKSAQMVKRDLMAPAKLFGSKGSKGGGAHYDAAVQAASADNTIYQDYDGNVITKEQYDALMAQQAADAGGYSPDQSQGFDQSQVDEPTYSMDQVAADMFAQSEEGAYGDDTNTLDIIASMNNADVDAGFDDNTFPLTGEGAQEMFASDGFDESDGNYAGIDQDPYDQQFLPQQYRQNTMDAYAADQTSGDNIIMPAGEPSMPYSGDEFAVMYESEDNPSRGAAWSPDPMGHSYMNVDYGGQELPGFWQGYGGFDWNWDDEGLGAVVARPNAHGLKYPAHMVLTKPTSTYGYFMKPGAGRPSTSGRTPPIMKPTPILADKKGNLFVTNGGSMHRIGSIDDLCDGTTGMGCASFGRDMGDGLSGGFKSFMKKVDPIAKKIASRVTPSGFLYERMQKNPKLYKKYRRAEHIAVPYAMIAAGTVVSVASVGAASPVGVAMIASGVASAGAQAYSDNKKHEAENTLDRAIEHDRIQEAIDSNDVIAESQNLTPSGGPAAGEIPGGDWPNQYPGDGVWADFLDLTDALVGEDNIQV